MDTIPPELLQYPALVAVALICGWLVKHFTAQMNSERQSYVRHMELERETFDKIANTFNDSSKNILSACENNTERMLNFMKDQDMRWRETVETRDKLFIERIKSLEAAIREVMYDNRKN